MKNANKDVLGFTLIELLVVVLIIGILASVALPQYQKAVEKSRATQAITLVKSLGEAGENYFMSNGTGPTTFDQLDISIPSDWTGSSAVYNVKTDARSNADWGASIEYNTHAQAFHVGRLKGQYAYAGFSYYLYYTNDTIPTHQLLCMEVVGKIDAGKFCEKLFHATLTHSGGLRLYKMP